MHVGLMGAGRIGAFHVRVLAASPAVDRLTITDLDTNLDTDLAARAADELGAGAAPSPQALVDGGVHALVIAAATSAHAELIRLGADAGLATFCEKPIALDLETPTRSSSTSPGPASPCRSASSGASTPATWKRGACASPERSAGGTAPAWRPTTRPRPTRATSPPPAASSGTCTSTTSTCSAGSPARRSSRSTPTARCCTTSGSHAMARWTPPRRCCAWPTGRSGSSRAPATTGAATTSAWSCSATPIASRSGWTCADAAALGRAGRPSAFMSPGYRNFMERFDAASRAEFTAFLEAARGRTESPCTGDDARRALLIAMAADRSLAEHRPVRLEEVA